jgi:hypothetical protein
VYGAGGELVFSGQDLSVGGVLSYFHDVLYIAAFVQLAGCATDYAWLAFLLVRRAARGRRRHRSTLTQAPAASLMRSLPV